MGVLQRNHVGDAAADEKDDDLVCAHPVADGPGVPFEPAPQGPIQSVWEDMDVGVHYWRQPLRDDLVLAIIDGGSGVVEKSLVHHQSGRTGYLGS